MKSIVLAVAVLGLATAAHAQPEPPSFLASPFTPMPEPNISAMPYVPTLSKGRDAYEAVRLVEYDTTNGIMRDYMVLTQNAVSGLAFQDVLSQCVSNGDVSSLLLERTIRTTKTTRLVKVINCSAEALDEKARHAQLGRARDHYMAYRALPDSETRRAVYAAFANEMAQ